MRFIRALFAALALALPNFSRGKNNAADKEADAVVKDDTRLVRPGTLAEVNKYEGETIAGGPGSQKIGDTFDALPQAERDAMIAARKGKVRTEIASDAISDGYFSHFTPLDRLSRGLRNR